MRVFTKGQKCVCPHCGEEQEDAVEDYTVPGHTGLKSYAEDCCIYCNKGFGVRNIDDISFSIDIA